MDPDRLKGAENGSTYRDRAGIAGLDWDEREARLTALVESLNEEEKEREERLTKFVNILLNNQQYLNKAQQNLAKRMNDLATQLQSEQELPKQLKVLEQHLKNG